MKNSKKGFTLVELLVVIAILAILATVAVVGYTSFIEKANLSNDQAFVAQANTTLQAAAIPNGFKTAGEAITALNRNGFQGKFNTYSSGFHYAYSLEKNKLYLVDDDNKVVYPDTDVELSSLWGLYMDNRTSYIDGVTKYVAMANITNSVHFDEEFTEASYTIDLNGCFIGIEGTHDNVTVNNGIVISGATAGEGIDTGYTVIDTELSSTDYSSVVSAENEEEIVIENKIFTKFFNPYTTKNIKFVNCVFYDEAAVSIDGDSDKGKQATFENCKFINVSSWAINVYRSVSLIDCTFTGLVTRGALQVNQAKNANTALDDCVEIEVDIQGCTFDGTAGDYPIIRFANGDRVVKSVKVSDCTFTTLNKAKGIIGHNGDNPNETAIANTAVENWEFKNNTFGEIPADKYVLGNATLNEAFKNSAK